jgi:hypothetical protein
MRCRHSMISSLHHLNSSPDSIPEIYVSRDIWVFPMSYTESESDQVGISLGDTVEVLLSAVPPPDHSGWA